MCRVYDSLYQLVNDWYGYDYTQSESKSWVNVIRKMFDSEGLDISTINVNGYYNRIKSNLKDIDVIRYEGKNLVKGSNWDRFYSDENWDWFTTDTSSGGHAKIVK
jgi:hypothetical protein